MTPYIFQSLKVASRRRYTWRNINPNPPTPLDNPNTISKGQRISKISSSPSHSKYLSYELLRSPEDKKIDDKIHEVVFKSESEKELIDIILDLQKRGMDTSSLVTQEDKEEFLEVVTSELQLEKESLDNLKETDPFEFMLKFKAGLPLPNWSYIVSGLKKPNNPPHISSSSFSASPTPNVHPPVMAAPDRYAPLVLPAILHDLPSKYAARILTWGSDEEISAEEFVDRFC